MLNNNIVGPLWKGEFQQQQQQQTLANNSAGSICCSNCCYVYPSVLWNILFLFISTANLQFAVVNKKAMAAQGKKALESRGSPLANAKEFFVKSEAERETSSYRNLTRNASHRKRPMHIPVFDKKDISRPDIYSNHYSLQ
jgi:hypothetical protein